MPQAKEKATSKAKPTTKKAKSSGVKQESQELNAEIDVFLEASREKPVPTKQSSNSIAANSLLHVIMIFIVGFFGGWVATQTTDTASNSIIEGSGAEIVLQESEIIADIAEKLSPSVVSINVVSETTQRSFFFGDRTFETEGEGTGIILTESGLVVTNKHVIPENATEISLIGTDGTEYTAISIIGRDPFNDIAFLQINDRNVELTPAPLGDSAKVRVGDKVIAIGNALGQFDNTVTAGIISGIGRPIVAGNGIQADQLQNLFQTDTAINPGNSGGPLVNMSGEVIGINTAVAGGAENIGFSIPINDVKPGITSVQDTGELVRPYLGVRYITVTKDIAQELDIDNEGGALITADAGQRAVLRDSPAEKAGLERDDVIVKVQATTLDESNPLVTTVSQFQVGETITLTVLRDNQEITIDVILEAAPEEIAN